MADSALYLTFDLQKSVEAASYLLKLSGGKMNYMKMLKLLFLVDRESFINRYITVTCDQPYSMKDGPVLSRIYNCIKYADPEMHPNKKPKIVYPEDFEIYEYWAQHIEGLPGKTCSLKKDPGDNSLSPFEERLIEKFYYEFLGQDQYQVRDWLHIEENCPEWHKIDSGRELIEFESWMEHHLKCYSPETKAQIREISLNSAIKNDIPGALSNEELLEILNKVE